MSGTSENAAVHGGEDVNEPVRVVADGNIGPVDATRVPRYAGDATFARLPRLAEVPRADVAVVGVPFDSGVGYQPGPGHIRESSRLLREYNPACGRRRSPASRSPTPATWRSTRSASTRPSAPSSAQPGLLEQAGRLLRRGPHDARAAAAARGVRRARPVSVVHFDAHLRHLGHLLRRRVHARHAVPPRVEGLLDQSGCLRVGVPRLADADLIQDSELGFQHIPAPDVEQLGVPGMVERIRARFGDRPVYVSVDIDVLDPAHAPGAGTGGRGPDQPRAAGHAGSSSPG